MSASRPVVASGGRTVLLVAGAGRSGTSTLAGLVHILGLRQPGPEVEADPSNPKGFGEARWVVEQHDRLLARAGVKVSDSRPDAWLDTTALCLREPLRMRVAAWLDEQLPGGPGVQEVVVKDPRLGWFLPLWRAAAERAHVRPVLATVLRPPAEVVRSKQTYYANRLGAAHLTASWLNMHLHLERLTRRAEESGMPRALVRYGDLLEDWVRTTAHLGRALDLRHVQDADVEQIRAGHRFVDPRLRRMEASLADLDLPPRLREIAEETWRVLDGLAEPGADAGPGAVPLHACLDELREAYCHLYAESEAITRSSVLAARSQASRRPPGPTPAVAASPRSAPDRHAADRVPHRVRALVPPGVRRRLRRALGRPR